jgi:ABC-type Fe3+-hydroxamate transport system substrate-binding protein
MFWRQKAAIMAARQIYQMLKLPPTEKALKMEEGFENISLEVLPEYVGDHVFVYGANDEGASDILDSDLWKGLPAVQKGQVYMYGSFDEKATNLLWRTLTLWSSSSTRLLSFY